MPIPVSETANEISRSAPSRTETSMWPPAGVNLTALDKRLPRILRNAWGSALQWVRCPRQVFDNANAFAARRFAGLRRFVGNKVGDVDRLVDKNFAPRLNLGE